MVPALRELTPGDWPAYFRGMQPLWGGGLAEEPFVAYQRRLMRSPEAAGRCRLVGLVEGGQLLSAFKAYELHGPCDGAPLRFLGIGAVFTPSELRRRGHASEMLRRSLDEHAALGFDAALLFSDIGAPFYRRLGFALLESREALVDAAQLPRGSGFRPAAPGDEAAISEMLAAHRAPRGLWLARDGWVVRFQLRRLRELARARNVGEPEWGLLAQGGAALVRLSKDCLDVLDAAWTGEAGREAVFAGLRDSCLRAGRGTLRLWPAHQLRGIHSDAARPTALAMIKTLRAGPPLQPSGAELTLLDHI